MFHPSSQHPFDTMFIIICVIAGANSHSFSNSSRSATVHLLNHRYKYSFIDLIMDASLIQFSRSSRAKSDSNLESSDDVRQSHLLDILPSNDNNLKQSYNVCTLLSNVLNGSQMKFCTKHQELLEIVMPQVVELAKEECVKITYGLKWNCKTLDPFLDRSSSLAFTREAALIRSMLNASMMYLIVKICTDHSRHSCSCSMNQDINLNSKPVQHNEPIKTDSSNLIMDQVTLDHDELDKLDTGSPLRISRSLVQHQGRRINSAFANAFTRILFDADETKSLNKAFKILNEDYSRTKSRRRQFTDADHRDLSFIKWTKSAVNLHNNHVGRQLVRMAIHKRCRCHGLSGACQFQTCWDEIGSFGDIASSIRTMYLESAHLVKYKNLGSVERPDIYLSKMAASNIEPSLNNESSQTDHLLSIRDRIKSSELAYLYESPEYCDDHPMIKHTGTKGRQCILEMSPSQSEPDSTRAGYTSTDYDSNFRLQRILPGSCEHLCCGRGYYSELVLHVVKCDCRFKFCCKVECADCPRQHLQHFCL